MYSVLIMSCDSYDDTWDIFFKLYNKYFKNNNRTYVCTETKECEYNTTIKTVGSWTSRLRQALEQIDSKYVILMLDDFFIREYVDQERIQTIIGQFNDNTATYNFEKNYDMDLVDSALKGFKLRRNRTPYLNSCQPSIHDRLKLIERLQQDQTPWEWELSIIDSPYEFYINSDNFIIDIGYHDHQPFSIKGGKWCNEVIEFLNKEKIEVDYDKRGIY